MYMVGYTSGLTKQLVYKNTLLVKYWAKPDPPLCKNVPYNTSEKYLAAKKILLHKYIVYI